MPKTNKIKEKVDDGAVAKSITIMPHHQRFIDARSINLSKFVQKKLDEEINVQGWKDN